MSYVKNAIVEKFSETALLRIFEVANIALNDEGLFEKACDEMDLAPTEMGVLHSHLNEFMESDEAYLSH